MRRVTRLTSLFVAAALVVSACGGDDDDDTAEPTAQGIASQTVNIDEPVSISTLVGEGVAGAVTASGVLLVDGDEARLCAALLESAPPQCGEPSVLVEGLTDAAIDDLEGITELSGVRYTDGPIELEGTLEGETLTVTP